MELEPTDAAPKITEKDFRELQDNFDDLELWKKKFPPKSYILKGIGVMNLYDVSNDHSVNEITSNLLARSHDTLSKIEGNLSEMLGIPELKVNFMGIEETGYAYAKKAMGGSMALGDEERVDCNQAFCSGEL